MIKKRLEVYIIVVGCLDRIQKAEIFFSGGVYFCGCCSDEDVLNVSKKLKWIYNRFSKKEKRFWININGV